MNNKDIIEIINVPANTQDVYDSLPNIPLNDVWKIKSFGACDLNNGDNKSSFYLLKYGNTNICPICITGNTVEININKEFKGDGNNKFTVVYKNNSSESKNLAFWIRAVKRS